MGGGTKNQTITLMLQGVLYSHLFTNLWCDGWGQEVHWALGYSWSLVIWPSLSVSHPNLAYPAHHWLSSLHRSSCHSILCWVCATLGAWASLPKLPMVLPSTYIIIPISTLTNLCWHYTKGHQTCLVWGAIKCLDLIFLFLTPTLPYFSGNCQFSWKLF